MVNKLTAYSHVVLYICCHAMRRGIRKQCVPSEHSFFSDFSSPYRALGQGDGYQLPCADSGTHVPSVRRPSRLVPRRSTDPSRQPCVRDIQEQRHGALTARDDGAVRCSHGHRRFLLRRFLICALDVSTHVWAAVLLR